MAENKVEKKNKKRGAGYLFAPLLELEAFTSLAGAVKDKGVYAAYGLDDSQRLHLLAALQRASGRLLVVITATDQLAQKAMDDLSVLLGGKVALFPAREVAFQRMAAASGELSARRLEALGAAATGQVRALVAPVDALMFPLMPAKTFAKSIIQLKEGDTIAPDRLMDRLVAAGYERVSMVEGVGQCASRGGIVDVYPVGRSSALRMEFFDDELDSLREFDALSQRSTGQVSAAMILPAREIILTQEEREAAAERLEQALTGQLSLRKKSRQKSIEEKFDLAPWEEFAKETEDDEDRAEEKMGRELLRAAGRLTSENELQKQFLPRIESLKTAGVCAAMESLMPLIYEKCDSIADYLPEALFVLDQPDRLRSRADNRALEFQEMYKTALERECALTEQASLLMDYDRLLLHLTTGRAALVMNPLMTSLPDIRPQQLFRFSGLSGASFQGNMKEFARQMAEWKKQGWRVAVLAGGVARGERLQKTLEEFKCPVEFQDEPPERLEGGRPLIAPLSLTRGFQYPDLKYAVVTQADVYGVAHQKARGKWKAGSKIAAFTDLQVGDYVVHENYGIGVYQGTVRLQIDGAWGDYLDIHYQDPDRLYVPTDQLDRVQKYVGPEGKPPKVNRLSGPEWRKQKAKVQADVQEIASDLVKLYAERQEVKGYAFSPDTPWQREFEDSFPYDETDDQLTAIEEIKRDMESPKVMDRLLCGDVGYGKTEVALRAIFKCVMDGRQAALLAPTTILAQQHFATIKKRFANFPVRADVISRFRTPAEQKAVLESLARGEIDVIVGTHRLLGKDVHFDKLGLLVVDEEQRFGVQHKEAIKQMRKDVDVLTLSATPIPRTLHMSMVGIRDMSLLRTPPEERYPVQTYVVEYSDGLIRDAILRELARDGQVYVLYNKVQSIERFYERLKKLVPEARVGVGHGQMREHMLEDVMMDFYEGKYDVLLCTTIIEAGLDVPRANTLIVIDSDRFGLSQLYQIRGRVGRSNRLAYAYLTIKPGKVLTENAEKRLEAIREFTEFGAGFRVAMRDLEIRGTGNLLGTQQSGNMTTVGYDLYVKMIEESVNALRGELPAADIETHVELRIDAYLPASYVPNDRLRIDVYKKIAQIDSADSRGDVLEELIDRFGDPPRPVMNLIDIAHFKGLANRIGVDNVSLKRGMLALRFSQKAQLDPMKLIKAMQKYPGRLSLAGSNPPVLMIADGNRAAGDLLRRAIPLLEDVVNQVTKTDE